MIIKQNEKVDQIYHCRCRSAVCGWFNDAAGNMIVVLGPRWKRPAALEVQLAENVLSQILTNT